MEKKNYTFNNLLLELSGKSVVEWMISKKLVSDKIPCPNCNRLMKLHNKTLKCNKRKCNKSRSIFKDTDFFGFKLELWKLFVYFIVGYGIIQ